MVMNFGLIEKSAKDNYLSENIGRLPDKQLLGVKELRVNIDGHDHFVIAVVTNEDVAEYKAALSEA